MRSRNIFGSNRGSLAGRQLDDEHPGAGGGERGLDTDLPALEPVELLAAVEHHLEGAERDREEREAEQVEPPFLVGLDGMKRSSNRVQTAPTGRLTRNTQRQL